MRMFDLIVKDILSSLWDISVAIVSKLLLIAIFYLISIAAFSQEIIDSTSFEARMDIEEKKFNEQVLKEAVYSYYASNRLLQLNVDGEDEMKYFWNQLLKDLYPLISSYKPNSWALQPLPSMILVMRLENETENNIQKLRTLN